MPNNTVRVLRCLVAGDTTTFKVTATVDNDVDDLKELVHEKGIDASKDILAKNLVLWKVRTSKMPLLVS
jgi:Crinkler effector protein N-terminal domain